ncbi:MAG: ribosome silencing factor [Sandaracinus sp.]
MSESKTTKKKTSAAAPKKAAPKKSATAKATAPKGSAARAPATRASRAPKKEGKPAASEAPGKRIALAIAEAALDKKAVNVEIIDVLGKVDYADYLVVMSGRSDRQVAALARGIEEDVEAKTKTKCLGVEGASQGRWVLMDFGDVVVHIFHEDVRGYYDIESLWMDAARVPVAAS